MVLFLNEMLSWELRFFLLTAGQSEYKKYQPYLFSLSTKSLIFSLRLIQYSAFRDLLGSGINTHLQVSVVA